MSTTVLSTTSPDLSTVTALAAGVPALLRKAGRAMATWQEAAKKAHLAALRMDNSAVIDTMSKYSDEDRR